MSTAGEFIQFEIRTRDASGLIAALERGEDAAAIQKRFGVESSLSETPARDPRRFGVTGAYPRVGKRVSPQLIVRLYEEVGLYSAVVDAWAEATWASGWKLQSKNEAWIKAAEALDYELRAHERFEEADTWVLQHGHAGIYFNLEDTSQTPLDEPSRVKRAIRLTVLDGSELAKANKDAEGEVESFDARFEQGNKRVHASRVLLLREKPKNDPLRGRARLRPVIDDVLYAENTKWTAAESFHQRAAPFLQVKIDPTAKLKDEDAEVIKDQVAQLQNGLIQKVIAEKFSLEPVGHGGAVLNPTPYWNLSLDSVCISARLPRHLVVGTAAGALESAGEDTRRFNARVTRRRSKYATGGIFAYYERLAEWRLLPEVPEDLEIVWPSLDEPTDEQIVKTAQGALAALTLAARMKLPAPTQIAQVLDFPDGVDLTKPLELVPTQAPANPFGAPGAPGGLPSGFEKRGRENALPLAKLDGLDARFRVKLLDALREWRATAERAIEAATRQRFRIFEARPDDAHRALLSLKLDAETLEAVVRELLEEAGSLGAMQTWEQLGRRGDVLKFVQSGRVHVIREFSRAYSEERAFKATEAVQKLVAENIAKGGGIAELKVKLRDTFGRLENEAAIARTETMRGYNNGSLAQMKESGIRRYRHRTWEGACPICSPLDGQEYDVDDASGLPPSNTHPYCRCYPEPVIVIPGESRMEPNPTPTGATA